MRGHIILCLACILGLISFSLWSRAQSQVNPYPPGSYLVPTSIRVANKTLTSTQVDGMFAAPITLIEAQGPGTLIVIDLIVYNAVFGTNAFTGGGNLFLYYGAVSPPVSQASVGTVSSFLTSFAENQVISCIGMNGTAGGIVPSSIALNAPVAISNNTGPFASGTGSSLTVTVYYRVLAGVK